MISIAPKTKPTNPTKTRSSIQVLNTQKQFRIYSGPVAEYCRELLRVLNCPEHALTVAFVDAAAIKELNLRYRGRGYATDVLSFGYDGEVIDGRPFLGEIVLAPEIAWRQARRWRGRPEREICKLLMHGILHLLGYDHETDAGEMNSMQRRLMRRAVFRQCTLLVAPREKK